MKLEYNIETILFHLKHVKRMCMENPDCTGCPFYISGQLSYGEYCMFAGIIFDGGVNPEEWDLDTVIIEGR